MVVVLPKIKLEDYQENQILAAQLLATKDDTGMTIKAISESCGVEPRTIHRWKADPMFLDLLLYYAEIEMAGYLPELYSSLRKSVRQGSTRAMELVLKNRGLLIDKKEVTGSLTVEQTLSLGQEELISEIEELKQKVLASTKGQKALPRVIEAEYEEL